MTRDREEQIIKASQLYAKPLQKPFVDGAMWSDKHPKDGLVAIDEVCEWLGTHAADYEQSAGTCDSWYSTSELVDAFRRHMEEQQ